MLLRPVPCRARLQVLYASCCAHPPPFSIHCAVNGHWRCVQSGAADTDAAVVCRVHASEWHLGPCVLLSEASAGIHSLPAPVAPPWDHRLLCLLFHFSHPRVEQKFWILVQVKRPCVRLFWRPSLPCWPVFLSRVPHCVTYCDFKSPGTSLVVQWLRLQAPDAKTPGLIPDPGTIVYTLQLRPGHNK